MKKMSKKLFSLVCIIMAAAMLIAGCAKEPGGENTAAPSEEAGAAKEDLTVVVKADVRSFDPIFGNDTAGHAVFRHIYETLVKYDANGNLVPNLAESVTWTDNKDCEIKLKKGVLFHNGEELKANDVKFTLYRIAAEPCDIHYMLQDINLDSFETPDDYTVKFSLNNPDASVAAILAFGSVGIVNEKAVTEAGDNYGMNPIGTGPYKLQSWTKGNQSVIERFEDYHGDKPAFKTITFKVVPEVTNRLVELESGGADLAYDISVTDVARVEESSALKLSTIDSSSVTFMGMNTSKAPLNDQRVREAIRYAIDVNGIVNSVYRGISTPASNPMNPSCIYYDKTSTVSEYNVEKAKQLMTEAGYADGFDITITTDDRKERIDMATIIQSELKEIGINAEIKILEWGAYLTTCYDGEQELYMGGWTTFTPEPSLSLKGPFSSSSFGSGGNMTFYSNPKVDELLTAGLLTTDVAEREQIYTDLQREITNQCTWVYLTYGVQIYAMNSKLEGFVPQSSGYPDLTGVYFAD